MSNPTLSCNPPAPIDSRRPTLLHSVNMSFDRNLIEEYARGGQVLRRAVEGLSREQLQAFPIPGTWSIQQIVVHLLDADLVAIDRMKRIVAMDNPLLLAYDESAFMRTLHPEEQPVEQVLQAYDALRTLWAITLRKLPDEAFQRTGIHNERGKVTLAEQLKTYIDHLNHHLAFIEKKRKMVTGQS